LNVNEIAMVGGGGSFDDLLSFPRCKVSLLVTDPEGYGNGNIDCTTC
jgi:hypothetical protein